MANTVRNQPGTERATVTPEMSSLDNMQMFYENNKNRINTIVVIVLVVVGGYLGYTKLYKGPQDEKAATAISYAQRYFQADSVNLALNGDGQHIGFLKAIQKYSGSNTANLCHFYAGECYLHMGDYNNAIKYLKDFDGKGTLVAYQANGSLGNAYMETGNIQKGEEYYKMASGDKDDPLLTPLYLYRLGIAYEMDNKQDEAKKAFVRIRDEYPKAPQARDIDKELARLGQLD